MQLCFCSPCSPAAPLRRASRWPPLKGQLGSKTVIWRRGCGDAAAVAAACQGPSAALAAAAAVAAVVVAAVAAAASRRPLPPPAKSETLSFCKINCSNIFTCLVRNHAYWRLSTSTSVVWRLRLLLPRPRRLRRGRPLEERLPAAEEVRRDWSRGIQPWSASLLNEEEEEEADCLMEGGALWITPHEKLLMMTTTRLYADCCPKMGPKTQSTISGDAHRIQAPSCSSLVSTHSQKHSNFALLFSSCSDRRPFLHLTPRLGNGRRRRRRRKRRMSRRSRTKSRSCHKKYWGLDQSLVVLQMG